jgi:hypothetical protein
MPAGGWVWAQVLGVAVEPQGELAVGHVPPPPLCACPIRGRATCAARPAAQLVGVGQLDEQRASV